MYKLRSPGVKAHNLESMKVYVSFDGDHIGRMVGRASLADKPEEVSRIAQAIERGNAIWQSWAESHGGSVINIGGDEGRLIVEADHLEELPKIRTQYEEAVGSTVSVGVGMKLSEADKSLMAAKMQGGNRIQLYAQEVDDLLQELHDPDEKEKLYEEYLNPETGLNKAQPGMNPGAAAGFSGASRSQPAAPQQGGEASEHSEAEVARGIQDGAPAQQGAADYESMFHQAAAQHQEEPAQKPTGLQDGVREQVVKILQDVRGHAPELEQMKGSNPALYESVKGLVEAMIALARSQEGGQPQPQQEEPVEKGEKVRQCGWKLGERRCQRMVAGQYCHDHKDHWANKIKQKEAVAAPEAPLEKGDVVNLNPPAPTGKKFRANAKVEDARGDFGERRLQAQAARPAVAPTAHGLGAKDDVYDYSHHLPPNMTAAGYSLHVHQPKGGEDGPFPDSAGFHVKLVHGGKPVRSIWALPSRSANTAGFSSLNNQGAVGFGGVHMADPMQHEWPSAAVNAAAQQHAPVYQTLHAQGALQARRTPPKMIDPSIIHDKGDLSSDHLRQMEAYIDASKKVDWDQVDDATNDMHADHLKAIEDRIAQSISHDKAAKVKSTMQQKGFSVVKDDLMDKAALEAGKTGRHQVVLPVGSQVDPGPSAAHAGGEIKVRDPETQKTKWRQVRSGLVMGPDGNPTSSRNPSGS